MVWFWFHHVSHFYFCLLVWFQLEQKFRCWCMVALKFLFRINLGIDVIWNFVWKWCVDCGTLKGLHCGGLSHWILLFCEWRFVSAISLIIHQFGDDGYEFEGNMWIVVNIQLIDLHRCCDHVADFGIDRTVYWSVLIGDIWAKNINLYLQQIGSTIFYL